MKIDFLLGDITTLAVDAIVNAANVSLLGGGGVDGAIHRAAGAQLVEACRAFGTCCTGEAVVTPGFQLPCRLVIHTPAPVWRGGKYGEAELLKSCYRNSLLRAAEHGCKSIAFPAISTGVYRYPKREAAQIALETVEAWGETLPEQVIFCCFSAEDLAIYRQIAAASNPR